MSTIPVTPIVTGVRPGATPGVKGGATAAGRARPVYRTRHCPETCKTWRYASCKLRWYNALEVSGRDRAGPGSRGSRPAPRGPGGGSRCAAQRSRGGRDGGGPAPSRRRRRRGRGAGNAAPPPPSRRPRAAPAPAAARPGAGGRRERLAAREAAQRADRSPEGAGLAHQVAIDVVGARPVGGQREGGLEVLRITGPGRGGAEGAVRPQSGGVFESAAQAERQVRADMGAEDLFEQDRKSTRLNSSHQIISYAVFCLKKKKHTSE